MVEVYLDTTERERLLSTLTPDQRKCLENMKISRHSKLREQLAQSKGRGIDEELLSILSQWDVIGYVKSESRSYKCDNCGMSLKYRFTVMNVASREIRHLGRDCCENFTLIPINLALEVYHGNYKINIELDQILKRNEAQWTLKEARISIPEKFDQWGEEVQRQIDLGLPLSDTQIEALRRAIDTYLYAQHHSDSFTDESRRAPYRRNSNPRTSSSRSSSAFRAQMEQSRKTRQTTAQKPRTTVMNDPPRLIRYAMEYMWVDIANQGVTSQNRLMQSLLKRVGYHKGKMLDDGKPELYHQISQYIHFLQEKGRIRIVEDTPYDRKWEVL